jgi:hypothetical protein
MHVSSMRQATDPGRSAWPFGPAAEVRGYCLGGSDRAYPVPPLHPWDELVVAAQIIGADMQPSAHRPAAHLHQARRCRRDQGTALLRIDTDHGAAVAAGGDRHVARDEEGEAAEHLLLSQIGSAADELSDTIGEFLITGHAGEPTQRCGGGAGPGRAAAECRARGRLPWRPADPSLRRGAAIRRQDYCPRCHARWLALPGRLGAYPPAPLSPRSVHRGGRPDPGSLCAGPRGRPSWPALAAGARGPRS